ncbi:MAG: class I SAM-dependent methyltransferase [Anaerolineales bacterium]|nr:class I SAM-dependent methyltransferase [Anaerolineales bacterium]
MDFDEIRNAHDETRRAWEANARAWDECMTDAGNDFVNVLCWPALERLLVVRVGQRVLDIACGNGLLSLRLANLGAEVVGFDFSANLIELARQRTAPDAAITYHVLDATEGSALENALGGRPFDAALCNMALFDIADIDPLFATLPKLLKPGGIFVFSLTHPAFNNASAVHVAEELDVSGEIRTVYSVKVGRYMTPYQARGLAIRGQPQVQVYFERPLEYYLNRGFRNNFVLDGFEERAFPPNHPQGHPLGWGGKFSEIPPVLVARMRLPELGVK